ncbi:MAG: hypothetical protein ABR562_04345 [Thermoplasmatota archaeon]|nr:hypothetical protein [Halobacteriales archaeon]
MRGVLALSVAVLLLAGCSSKSADPTDGTSGQGKTDAARPTTDAKATGHPTSGSTTGTQPTKGPSGSGTSGAPGAPGSPGAPGGGNSTAARTYGVVVSQHFAGNSPIDPPTDPTAPFHYDFPFDVPTGADHLVVYYNATYNGLFNGYGEILGTDGSDQGNSLDMCGISPPGAGATSSCLLEVVSALDAGTWHAHLVWQVGEVNEAFTFDVIAWGYK